MKCVKFAVLASAVALAFTVTAAECPQDRFSEGPDQQEQEPQVRRHHRHPGRHQRFQRDGEGCKRPCARGEGCRCRFGRGEGEDRPQWGRDEGRKSPRMRGEGEDRPQRGCGEGRRCRFGHGEGRGPKCEGRRDCPKPIVRDVDAPDVTPEAPGAEEQFRKQVLKKQRQQFAAQRAQLEKERAQLQKERAQLQKERAQFQKERAQVKKAKPVK